jgi:hypothetical protein
LLLLVRDQPVEEQQRETNFVSPTPAPLLPLLHRLGRSSSFAQLFYQPEVGSLDDHRLVVGSEVSGRDGETVLARPRLPPLDARELNSVSTVNPPALASEACREVAAFQPPSLALVQVSAPVLVGGDALLAGRSHPRDATREQPFSREAERPGVGDSDL